MSAQIDWDSWYKKNWATMSAGEQKIWLKKFVLSITHHDAFTDGDLDVATIVACEQYLKANDKTTFYKYVDNCIVRVSGKVYADKTQDYISENAAKITKDFYSEILTLDIATKGICMFWAVRGESV